jgi:hypothetical protein
MLIIYISRPESPRIFSSKIILLSTRRLKPRNTRAAINAFARERQVWKSKNQLHFASVLSTVRVMVDTPGPVSAIPPIPNKVVREPCTSASLHCISGMLPSKAMTLGSYWRKWIRQIFDSRIRNSAVWHREALRVGTSWSSTHTYAGLQLFLAMLKRQMGGGDSMEVLPKKGGEVYRGDQEPVDDWEWSATTLTVRSTDCIPPRHQHRINPRQSGSLHCMYVQYIHSIHGDKEKESSVAYPPISPRTLQRHICDHHL